MGCVTSICAQGTYSIADALRGDKLREGDGTELDLLEPWPDVDLDGNPVTGEAGADNLVAGQTGAGDQVISQTGAGDQVISHTGAGERGTPADSPITVQTTSPGDNVTAQTSPARDQLTIATSSPGYNVIAQTSPGGHITAKTSPTGGHVTVATSAVADSGVRTQTTTPGRRPEPPNTAAG